ncbi:MAG: hypothetical protein QXG18_02380 [Candidatus Pacearchaeota archaeon]
MKKTKGAMELSIGTIVIIVISMSMLILGIMLVRNIFTGAKYNVDQINDKVRDEISRLFAEETKAIVYLPNNKLDIRQGESWGVAFAIKNKAPSQEFSWETKVNDQKVFDKCGITDEDALSFIVSGEKGTTEINSGGTYYDIIRFNIPEGSINDVSKCIIRYQIIIRDQKGSPYQAVSFDVQIK